MRIPIAVLAAVMVAGCAGCETTVTGSAHRAAAGPTGSASSPPAGPAPTPPPPGPLVLPGQVKGLLPPADQVSGTTGIPDLIMTESHDTISLLPDDWLSDPACIGSISNAGIQPYADSAYIRVRTEDFMQPGNPSTPSVINGVILYQRVQDATDQVAAIVGGWASCADKTVRATNPTSRQSVSYTIGNGAESDRTHTMVYTRTPAGWACGRGITSRANVVIDVTVCSTDTAAVGFHAQGLVDQIADRIPE